MKKSCLMIAGEKSGEEHCETFYPALQKRFPECDFFGVGGDLMLRRGFRKIYHLNDFSSWGFSEVIFKIPFYINALKRIEQEVERIGCKVAILIDFQDFNLRLAKRLSKNGVKVLYYVAPQAWAWKAWRAKVLADCVSTLFTILPFEKKWFRDRGVKQVHSIDHPLLRLYQKELENFSRKKEIGSNVKRILLLPGSRNFEVKNLLPDFLEALAILKRDFKLEVSIVKVDSVNKDVYTPYLKKIDRVFESKELVTALTWADIAIAASGTVTLATALFSLPTIVTYKTSLLNEYLYVTFVSYNGPISLANILFSDNVFPELVQDRCSAFNIAKIAKSWLTDELLYEKIVVKLNDTKTVARGSDRSATENMIEVVNSSYGE